MLIHLGEQGTILYSTVGEYYIPYKTVPFANDTNLLNSGNTLDTLVGQNS